MPDPLDLVSTLRTALFGWVVFPALLAAPWLLGLWLWREGYTADDVGFGTAFVAACAGALWTLAGVAGLLYWDAKRRAA
jgi:hypothetical protein